MSPEPSFPDGPVLPRRTTPPRCPKHVCPIMAPRTIALLGVRRALRAKASWLTGTVVRFVHYYMQQGKSRLGVKPERHFISPATDMRPSVKMIEMYYSDVIPDDFAKQLEGSFE